MVTPMPRAARSMTGATVSSGSIPVSTAFTAFFCSARLMVPQNRSRASSSRVLLAHALHFVGFEQREAVGLGAMSLVAPEAGVDPVADPAFGLGPRHGGLELRHQRLQPQPQHPGAVQGAPVIAGFQAHNKLARDPASGKRRRPAEAKKPCMA